MKKICGENQIQASLISLPPRVQLPSPRPVSDPCPKADPSRSFSPQPLVTARAFPLSVTCGCGNPARPGQPNCWDCHASYMRTWRQSHAMTDAKRLRSNCRSYTKVYIRRGKLVPEPCLFCGDPATQPHHEDYSKPLEVHWLCREHHLALEGKTVRKYQISMARYDKCASRSPHIATNKREGTNPGNRVTNRKPQGFGNVTPPTVASPSLPTGAQPTARREVSSTQTARPVTSATLLKSGPLSLAGVTTAGGPPSNKAQDEPINVLSRPAGIASYSR